MHGRVGGQVWEVLESNKNKHAVATFLILDAATCVHCIVRSDRIHQLQLYSLESPTEWALLMSPMIYLLRLREPSSFWTVTMLRGYCTAGESQFLLGTLAPTTSLL